MEPEPQDSITGYSAEEQIDMKNKVALIMGRRVTGWGRWSSPVVGIDSIPFENKPSIEASMQTEPVLYVEIGTTASPAQKSIPVQVDMPEPVPDYPASLLPFMDKAMEVMIKELLAQSAHRKQAPEPDYSLSNKANWENEGAREYLVDLKIKSLQKVTPTVLHNLRNSAVPREFAGKSISWSPQGSLLAVGYSSNVSHNGWCRHNRVSVTVWTLRRCIIRDGPLISIPFDSCVTILQFNPKFPNYIAVGFFSGEVALIDLNGEDKVPEVINTSKTLAKFNDSGTSCPIQNAASKACQPERFEFRHHEAFVTVDGSCHAQEPIAVQWIFCDAGQREYLTRKNPAPSKHFFVTASRDGFIGLWSLDERTSRLYLERRYVILPTNIPEIQQRRCLFPASSRRQLGIVAFDCKDPTSFICTTTGNFMFRGTLMHNLEISELDFTTSSNGITPIYDTRAQFVFVHQEHEQIYKIRHSPFLHNLYAYVTASGKLVMYTFEGGNDPLLALYLPVRASAVTDIHWTKRRMLFGVSVNNMTLVFDLLLDRYKPVMTIEHDEILTAVDFNMFESGYLAGADMLGRTVIWQLPPQLFTMNAELEEEEFLDFAGIGKKAEAIRVAFEEAALEFERMEREENVRRVLGPVEAEWPLPGIGDSTMSRTEEQSPDVSSEISDTSSEPEDTTCKEPRKRYPFLTMCQRIASEETESTSLIVRKGNPKIVVTAPSDVDLIDTTQTVPGTDAGTAVTEPIVTISNIPGVQHGPEYPSTSLLLESILPEAPATENASDYEFYTINNP